MPEPRTGKTRVHLDVRLADPDPAALLAAGARLVREPDAEIGWWVLADPDGNQFCAFPPGEGKRPGVFELVVDSADPAAQARWWAGVVGGQVGGEGEDYAYLTGAAGFPWGSWIFDPVSERKRVKNRVHWDVELTGAEVTAVISAGATLLREPDDRIGCGCWPIRRATRSAPFRLVPTSERPATRRAPRGLAFFPASQPARRRRCRYASGRPQPARTVGNRGNPLLPVHRLGRIVPNEEVVVQDTRALALTFEVSGLPPVKTEALSIFAAGHRQATRVRALLQAACTAAQQTGWTPLAGPIEVDLTLRCPPGHRTSDASTLLGGVCAVLQDKKRVANIGLAHLGVLVDVALYDDDRQIRRLSYIEEPAEDFSYQVRVAAVPTVV